MLEAKESLRSPGQYGRPTTRSPDDGKNKNNLPERVIHCLVHPENSVENTKSSTLCRPRREKSSCATTQPTCDHRPARLVAIIFYFFAPTTTVKHDSLKNPPPQPPQPRQNNPPEAHSVFSWGEKSRVGLGGKTNSCSKQTALVSKKYKKLDTKNLSNF
jgi:hypothetical protein